MRAASLKLLKKWRNISVGISPTFSRGTQRPKPTKDGHRNPAPRYTSSRPSEGNTHNARSLAYHPALSAWPRQGRSPCPLSYDAHRLPSRLLPYRQVRTGMLTDLVQHMIEETKPGRDRCLSGSIQIPVHINIRLLRGTPYDSTTLAANRYSVILSQSS